MDLVIIFPSLSFHLFFFFKKPWTGIRRKEIQNNSILKSFFVGHIFNGKNIKE